VEEEDDDVVGGGVVGGRRRREKGEKREGEKRRAPFTPEVASSRLGRSSAGAWEVGGGVVCGVRSKTNGRLNFSIFVGKAERLLAGVCVKTNSFRVYVQATEREALACRIKTHLAGFETRFSLEKFWTGN
jgi:hypothetical protein